MKHLLTIWLGKSPVTGFSLFLAGILLLKVSFPPECKLQPAGQLTYMGGFPPALSRPGCFGLPNQKVTKYGS